MSLDFAHGQEPVTALLGLTNPDTGGDDKEAPTVVSRKV